MPQHLRKATAKDELYSLTISPCEINFGTIKRGGVGGYGGVAAVAFPYCSDLGMSLNYVATPGASFFVPENTVIDRVGNRPHV